MILKKNNSIINNYSSDKTDFAPFTYSYSIEGEEINRDQNKDFPLTFEIANYDWFYDSTIKKYSWNRSLLKNAILPSHNDMKEIIKDYCLKHSISYNEADYDNKTDFIYTANNNVTIDYDL